MRTYEGGEEITLARLGNEGFRIVLGLLRILVYVGVALLTIWIVVPAPRGLFLWYAPWVCGILYALWKPSKWPS